MTEKLRIGMVGGEGPATLGDVASIEVDECMWAVDSTTGRLSIFDSAGS